MAAYSPRSSASHIQEYRNPSSCDEDDDDDEESSYDIEKRKKEEEWLKQNMISKRAKVIRKIRFKHSNRYVRYKRHKKRLEHNIEFSSESRHRRLRHLIAESLGQFNIYGKPHGLFACHNNSRVETKTFKRNRKIGYKIYSSRCQKEGQHHQKNGQNLKRSKKKRNKQKETEKKKQKKIGRRYPTLLDCLPAPRFPTLLDWLPAPGEQLRATQKKKVKPHSKPAPGNLRMPKGEPNLLQETQKKKVKTLPKPAPRNQKLPKGEPNLLREIQKNLVKFLPLPAPGNLKIPKGDKNMLQTTQKKTVKMDVERGQEGVMGTRSSRHPGPPETTILEIFGVPVQPQDNPVELVKKIGNALGEQIQDCDIDFCLRTTHYTSQLESPITVKFCTKSTKQRLFERWFRKGYLNTLNIGLTYSNPISIRENFCPIYTC